MQTYQKVNESDPWEGWNRKTQGFNDDFNNTIIKPVTKGYASITPGFFNDAAANFFSNLKDIGVTINDLLQLKMAQGSLDAGRFLINTTAGVGGLIDVATMMDLPKHNEDFGQTLGFWGVPSGNYLVMPFLGASSPRGVAGELGDALMNPLTYTFVFTGSGAVFSAINAGAKTVDIANIDIDSADLILPGKIADEAAIVRYDFIKNAYQRRRENLVNDGNTPDENELRLADDATTEDVNTEQIELNHEAVCKEPLSTLVY